MPKRKLKKKLDLRQLKKHFRVAIYGSARIKKGDPEKGPLVDLRRGLPTMHADRSIDGFEGHFSSATTNPSLTWLYVAFASFGAAVLAKGPIGILIPLIIMGAFHILQHIGEGRLKGEKPCLPARRPAYQ